MLCVDTTFLIDLWRDKNRSDAPARTFLDRHRGEDFVVPTHAAVEFLEGGASVSPKRLADSLAFARLFRIGEVGLETALHCARMVAALRDANALSGRSKPDLWLAAWAVEHAAALVTRNARDFGDIDGLDVLEY